MTFRVTRFAALALASTLLLGAGACGGKGKSDSAVDTNEKSTTKATSKASTSVGETSSTGSGSGSGTGSTGAGESSDGGANTTAAGGANTTAAGGANTTAAGGANTTAAGGANTGGGEPAAVALPAGVATIAQAKVSSVGIYPSAGAGSASKSFKNPIKSGAPLVFLVTEQKGSWYKVLLNQRPNGSTGWVRAQDVALVTTDYKVTVDLSSYSIVVMKGKTVVMNDKVGLGTSDNPTPPGQYYIVELLQPPNPNGDYGPYAYGLSGYSPTLETFGNGPGQLGLHGTNNPGAIGTNVSHGCIRLSNSNITKLAQILPLGTPVEIRA